MQRPGLLVLVSVVIGASPFFLENLFALPCAQESRRFCGDVRLGQGRKVECLKSHWDQLSSGCQEYLNRQGQGQDDPPAGGGIVKSIALLTDNGGRVDWYHESQASHELIAFDVISDKANANTEVFTMNPDGSGKSCVTCNAPIPKGFVGQAAWHPDGEHIVIQVENQNSRHTFYNHMAWGYDNDLWVIKRDGSQAQKIWATPKDHAALHPHFNHDGTLLFFAEKVPVGKRVLDPKNIYPGHENVWAGWQIHIADVSLDPSGGLRLTNHRFIRPNGSGMYETHEFTGDNRIVYSFTPGGRAYVDDGYEANLDGSNSVNLINSPKTWDEHSMFSPSGKTLTFMSSRVNELWEAPRSKGNTLRTELYMKESNGNIQQLTCFNAKGSPNKRYLVSDYDWDRSGQRIVFAVGAFDSRTAAPDPPQIWVLTFNQPQ